MTKLLSRPPVVEPELDIDQVVHLMKKVLHENRYGSSPQQVASGCLSTLVVMSKIDAFAIDYNESTRMFQLRLRFVPRGKIESAHFENI